MCQSMVNIQSPAAEIRRGKKKEEEEDGRTNHSMKIYMVSLLHRATIIITRMWANAQRDGRPAEYRWRPLFNAAVWLTPNTGVPCSNAAKMRNTLKFAGVPQTTGSISAASGPSS